MSKLRSNFSFFSLTIKLRVPFSSGSSRARSHDWISSFWKLLRKRLLYLNCGPSLYSPAPRTATEPPPTTHSPQPPTPTNHPPPTTTVPTEQAKTKHAWLGSRWILNYIFNPPNSTRSSQTCVATGHECEEPSVHWYSLLVPGVTQLHVASAGCETTTCSRASEAPAGLEQPRSKCDTGQAVLMPQTFTPLEGHHHEP